MYQNFYKSIIRLILSLHVVALGLAVPYLNAAQIFYESFESPSAGSATDATDPADWKDASPVGNRAGIGGSLGGAGYSNMTGSQAAWLNVYNATPVLETTVTNLNDTLKADYRYTLTYDAASSTTSYTIHADLYAGTNLILTASVNPTSKNFANHSASAVALPKVGDPGIGEALKIVLRVTVSGYPWNQQSYVDNLSLDETDSNLDVTAPTPDPMTWVQVPTPSSSTGVYMRASTASDISFVEYFFTNTVNGNTSGWIDDSNWQDTGLTDGVTYTYQVKARDKSANSNETAWSSAENVVANSNIVFYSSFEEPIVTGSQSGTNPSGWNDLSTGSNNKAGLGYLWASGYTNMMGYQAAYLNVYNCDPILQTTTSILDASLQVNNRYTVSFNATDTSTYVLYADLLAGTNVIVTASIAPSDQNFSNNVASANTLVVSGDAGIGEALSVRLRVTGGAWNQHSYIDNLLVEVEPSNQDYDPPTPDPMTWVQVPTPAESTGMYMVATTATDINYVEYFFTNTVNGNTSGWIDEPIWRDSGLIDGTTYSYKVKSRDKSVNSNETAWSSTESAVADASVLEYESFERPIVSSATSGTNPENWSDQSPTGNRAGLGNLTSSGYSNFEGNQAAWLNVYNAEPVLVSTTNTMDAVLRRAMNYSMSFNAADNGTYTMHADLMAGTNVIMTASTTPSDQNFSNNVATANTYVDRVADGIDETLSIRLRVTYSGYPWDKQSYIDNLKLSGLRTNMAWNVDATNVTSTTADLLGAVATTGTTALVTVFWGTTDGGTDPSNWDSTADIGTYPNIDYIEVTNAISGLTSATTYYYRFRASNATEIIWATNAASFETISPPTVTVNGGATGQGRGTATLNGILTQGGNALVYFCWGETDGGTSSTSGWENVIPMGFVYESSAFSTNLTGLPYGVIYDYRVFATNSAGGDWSGVDSFFTDHPTITGLPVTNGIQFWIAGDDIDGDGDTTDNPSDGSAISTWYDKTGLGGGRNATREGTTDPIYSTNGPNGKAVVSFDVDYLSTTYNFDALTEYTVFSVARYTNGTKARVISSATRNWLFGFHGAQDERWYAEGWIHQAGSGSTNWALHAGHINSAADPLADFYKNGSVLTSNDNGSNNNNYKPGRIGLGGYRNNNEESDAQIAEVIIYDSVLSTGDLDLVGGYLTDKYDLTTSYSPYSMPDYQSITNTAATNIAGSAAELLGQLEGPSAVWMVSAFWSTNNNADSTAWLADGDAMSASAGTFTNVSGQALSAMANSLAPDTTYYFTFVATNELTNMWASPNVSFATPSMPYVNNSTGATTLSENSVSLSGNLTTGLSAAAWFCWGITDGLTSSTSDWENVTSAGRVYEGVPFSSVINIETNTTYWYRTYVTNAAGVAWAENADFFNGTPSVTGSRAGFMMEITFTNFAGMGTLTNFPALIRLNTSNTSNYTGFLSLDGWDLRFWTNSALSGTELNYEIEVFNTNGSSFIWVQIPYLTNNLSIWASWGDSTLTNQLACTTNGSVWSEGFEGVWHLGSDVNDSTINERDGANSGSTDTGGQIGQGQAFGGDGDVITMTGYKGITGTFDRVCSAWILTSAGDNAILNWGANVTGTKWTFRTQTGNGTPNTLRTEVNGGYQVGSTVITDGIWHYVTAVLDSDGTPDVTEITLYVDGVEESISANLSQAINTASFGDVRIGDDFVGTRPFNGSIDEVRISSMVRSSNWVWACWMNQGNHDSFVSYDPPLYRGSLANLPPTGVTNSAATLNAALIAEFTNYTVNVYWGESDGGTNSASWASSATVGTWTNVSSTNISYAVGGLHNDTIHWYTFSASNTAGIIWATPSWSFGTMPWTDSRNGSLFEFK
jgi:hypothetical protein